MLKTYRIIPSTFILFLFGLTLITVSPVFAEDSAAFVECKEIGRLKEKKNCFRDLARELQTALDIAKGEIDSISRTRNFGIITSMGTADRIESICKYYGSKQIFYGNVKDWVLDEWTQICRETHCNIKGMHDAFYMRCK